MTKTSAVMGSPLYMSPEQMTASRHVDTRTDIWAIGVVLYELLTGRVPFNAETLPEICGLILTTTPQPVRNFSPGVPEGLQVVVERCLEKDRERRFSNVSELAHALAPFGSRATSRSGERIARILGASSGLDLAPQSEAPGDFGQGTQSNWGQTNAGRSSNVPLLVAAGVLALVLGGLGVFLFRAKGGAEPAPAASVQPVLGEPQAVAVAPVVAPIPPSVPSALPATAVTNKPVVAPALVHPNAAKVVAVPAKPVVVAPPAPVVAPAAPVPARAKRSVEDLLGGRN